MKIIKLIFLVSIGLLVYSSCSEERLDLEPLSETEEAFFDEEIDYERQVRGIYAKMTDLYWFGNNNWHHEVWLLPGDDITSNGGYNLETFNGLQPSNGDIGSVYATLYEMNARANTAIQKIPEAEEGIYITPNLQKYHEGEARFLKGWANFRLWIFWGTAPLVSERITSPDDITPPNSGGYAEGGNALEAIELLDAAIEQFELATGLLPGSWSTANRGRVTKNSAYGMLGKALVVRASWTGNQSDYTAAISAFNNITGVSLVEDFGDNFAADAENNAESLFEFQASNPTGTDNVWLPNDFNAAVGSMSAYWGFYDNHWSFWDQTPWVATDKLMTAYEPGDPRINYTYDSANLRIRKFVMANQFANTGVGSVNNPRILRYGDVVLLWAEALNETGDQAGAIAKINEVRTRARNMGTAGVPANRSTGASQDQVRQWIMQERLLELAGEECHRWSDLRRWHRAGHISLNNAFFSSVRTDMDFTAPDNLLFPIPNGEVDLNPNVKQNPGY